VLSSTAVIMQMMEERGETATLPGSAAVSILLLEDLAIVPLLALVALLASRPGQDDDAGQPGCRRARPRAIAGGRARRWLLDPFFAAREVRRRGR
jgi:glutathione-regulated potassium-efflux system protein KefB